MHRKGSWKSLCGPHLVSQNSPRVEFGICFMCRTLVLSPFSKDSFFKGVTAKETQKRRGLLEAQLRDAWIIIGIPFKTLQMWSCSFFSIFTFSTMWWISIPAGLASRLRSDIMRGISVKRLESLWLKPLFGRYSCFYYYYYYYYYSYFYYYYYYYY